MACSCLIPVSSEDLEGSRFINVVEDIARFVEEKSAKSSRRDKWKQIMNPDNDAQKIRGLNSQLDSEITLLGVRSWQLHIRLILSWGS
jgi:hypothetical protein